MNDYIEEQQRRRRELIELKKKQVSDPVVKPEEPKKPMTLKEKIQNFWYYNKSFTIIGLVLALSLALLISQCAKRVDYDLEVIYFTHEMVLIAQLDETNDYFKKYATDVNGDGKVNVLVINCSIDPYGDDVTYRNNILSRLQTELAADPKAMLFITDESSYEYLNNIDSDTKLFDSEPVKLGEKFYKNTESEKYGRLPDGLQISCRIVDGTALEKYKDSNKYLKPAKEFFTKFIADNK